MSQSLVCQLVHMVFSTKERVPMIAREIRNELFAYMGGVVRAKKSDLMKIGGTADHVHLLVSLHPTLATAQMIQAIKTNSSRWVRQKFGRKKFTWQGGYAAFSVSKSQVEKVKRYIENQEEHHRKRSFKEELRELLKSHGINFDESYLWD